MVSDISVNELINLINDSSFNASKLYECIDEHMLEDRHCPSKYIFWGKNVDLQISTLIYSNLP